MKVVIDGSLGDEVAVTGALREYRRQHPEESLTVQARHPDVFQWNPHLGARRTENGTVVRLALGTMPGGPHLVAGYMRQLDMWVAATSNPAPELFFTDRERDEWTRRWGTNRGWIAIDTWAGWPSRQWAWERFAALTRALAEEYRYYVVEVGKTQGDCYGQPRGPARLPADECYVDRMTLRETALLLERCALFVGNDSGLAHVAAAVGTPQVVIYGPVPATQRMYATTRPVEPYREACSCTERCHRETKCLDEVTMPQVLACVLQALR